MNWFSKNQTENLKVIGRELEGILRPVMPRQEFVRDLRSRLIAHSFQSVPVPAGQPVNRGLLLAGGVVGRLFVLLTTVRGILAVIGLIGLVVQRFGRDKRSPSSQLVHG